MTERKRLAVTVKTVSKGIAIARVGIAPKELNTEANNDSSDYRRVTERFKWTERGTVPSLPFLTINSQLYEIR